MDYLVKIREIEVRDSDMVKDRASSVLDLYQGDLFRGYIIKGSFRDESKKITTFLVIENPKGKDYPAEVA